jgi:hypothetical protein
MAPNDTIGHQGIDLPPGFHYGEVDFSPEPAPIDEPPPPLGVLDYFTGTFFGTGFNTIFRPNSVSPTTTKFPNPVLPAPPAPPNVAVLELNLTTELLSFSTSLGSVPNRGFDTQNDIFLNGVSYLQTVNDVTNTATGKADGRSVGIHTETGFWMNVPATAINPPLGNTLVRMGSIPHGTTINAQGVPPVQTQGAPDISPRSITPFTIGNPTDLKVKDSQTASNSDTPRLPQDLSLFIAQGTITQDILTNPVNVLTNINNQINITETLTFSVTTNSAPAELGGGTANIAFLVGQVPALGPNANAVEMDATFWVETVQAEITIQSYTPDQLQTPLLIQPNIKPSNKLPPPMPTFSVTPPGLITSPTTLTVHYTQIQYAQVVLLNFSGLSWPHISVATLVPAAPIEVPASAFGGTSSG